MASCVFCKSRLSSGRDTIKKFCCDKHRTAERRKVWHAQAEAWLEAPKPDCSHDPESALTGEKRPYGAAFYRLSCPAVCHGGRRFFPAGRGWRLFPFCAPQVPVAGRYTVTFYGTDQEWLQDGEEIEIGPAYVDQRAKWDTKKHLVDR